MSPCSYQMNLAVASLQDMRAFAARVAGWLKPGDVVALDGGLGAGKTTFVRLLGEALEIPEAVTSPTFVLMHEYSGGRLPLAHVDLYRLGEDHAESFADELFAVIDEGRAVVLIEWACYGESFLRDAVTLAIEIIPVEGGDEARMLKLLATRPLESLSATEQAT